MLRSINIVPRSQISDDAKRVGRDEESARFLSGFSLSRARVFPRGLSGKPLTFVSGGPLWRGSPPSSRSLEGTSSGVLSDLSRMRYLLLSIRRLASRASPARRKLHKAQPH